jgi:hypothetical protein
MSFKINNPFGFKKGHSPWHTGKTKEELPQLSRGGRKKGSKPWNIGIPRTKEEKLKMGKNRKGLTAGVKHPNWRGGISTNPYSVDWTQTFKRSIRERDNYTCQLCGKLQGDLAFCVHHIDYDKLNSNPNNLITLCHKCHVKTNFNREYWENLLNGTALTADQINYLWVQRKAIDLHLRNGLVYAATGTPLVTIIYN